MIFCDGGLHKSVANVDLDKWYKEKIKHFFRDTPFSQCFDPPYATVEALKQTWVPKCNSVKCPEYVNAVNVWIWLSENATSPFIRKCLFMFIDLHMHNIRQVDAHGVFTYVENDENDDTDVIIPQVIMDVLPPSKPSKEKNKILHALSKALPQRCQIRNLKEIIINYVSEDDVFFRFLLNVMKKALFGQYSHCKERLSFKGRYILFESFENQLQSKPFFCKWFRNGNDHQVLIFFCLKEYLIHAVREASPVLEVIDKKYGWGKFDSQVLSFMDKIRNKLNIIADREFNFMVRSDWIVNVESILINAAKSHIKLFRTTPQVTYYNKIHSLLMKYFTIKQQFNVYDIVTNGTSRFVWNVIQRLYNPENIFKVLHLFNVPEETVQLLLTKTFSKEHFEQQSLNTLKYILEVIRVLAIRKNFGIYVLPQHIFTKQIEAICKKEECTAADCVNYGLNYICFICNDIKMFIMKETNVSRHSNKLAKGSLRIVVNNQAKHNKLEYICGRRTERHQRHGKRKWKDNEAVANRKIIKEKQRDAVSHRCVNTPLTEIDMIGHFVCYFNKLMFLCTKCGNTCTINKQSLYNSNIISCSICSLHQKKKCEKCSMLVTCNDILALDRRIGRFRKANLCINCTAVHATAQPIIL